MRGKGGQLAALFVLYETRYRHAELVSASVPSSFLIDPETSSVDAI
jgi:hypothetical protein